MNIDQALQPALLRSRRALPPWVAPVLLGVAWLALLRIVGGATLFQWAKTYLLDGAQVTLAAAALYVLPGLTLVRLLWPTVPLRQSEQLVLASGVSLALPPLVLQVTHLLGGTWNTTTTASYVGVALLLLVAPPAWRWRYQQRGERTEPWWTWHGVLLGGSAAVALVFALYLVRNLVVGMWADSYHHTMIVQLLADHGGLFSSWEPYAPLATFTYHYGFHANTVFFHWLSGIPVTRSVVLVGQIINVAALAGSYLLAARLSGSRTIGLLALAFTAINMLPAFYVNWGRYTQLTGQAILPALLVCWMLALERQQAPVGALVLAAITTAGLLLTHYIVAIFAVLMLGVYVAVLVARTQRWATLVSVGSRSLAMSGGALVLAAPWLFTMLDGRLATNANRYIERSVDSTYIASLSTLLPLVPFYIRPVLAVLAAVGVVVALARRNWRVLLLLAWSQVLILAVVPQVFGLGGAGLVTNFAVYIALYITVVPLAAYAPGVLINMIGRRHAVLGQALLAATLVGTSVWSVRQHQDLIDPEHILFTPADAQAMEWIKTNTPPDALFLVNMDPAYNNTMFIGSDGGWWIPLLTQRQTTLPPMIQGHERFADPEQAQALEDLGFALQKRPLPDADAVQRVRDAHIRYLYRGAHVVQTDKSPNAAPLAALVNADTLRQDPAFRVVYEQNGVVIFAVVPPPLLRSVQPLPYD